MTLEIGLVFAIAAAVLILFISELVAVELVAISAMVVLMATGILTPAEGLAGFSHNATIVVAVMFIGAAALDRSGAIEPFARRFTSLLGRRPKLAMAGMLAGVAGLSAFVNNTPVVAALLPVLVASARAASISPSKLLIPLSFASIIGGTTTLIGTSTTLVVNDVARDLGQPAISMFEMAPMGLIFLAAGGLYLLTIGARLLPSHGDDPSDAQDFDFVSELRVVADGPLDGVRVRDVPIFDELVDAMSVFRRGQSQIKLRSWTRLEAHDVVRLVASRSNVERIVATEGLKSLVEHTSGDVHTHVVEVVITPYSPLAYRSLKALRFQRVFGAKVLGIRQRPQLSPLRLHKLALHPGDILLLKVTDEGLIRLRNHASVLIVSEDVVRPQRQPWLVVGILGVAVAAATAGVVALPTALLSAALLLLATGCLSTNEAYAAIEWRVIFLLAAIMSLGVAMEKTGAAALLADALVDGPGRFGPLVLLSALYLTTSILTEFISNIGTAVVLTPVAIAVAMQMGVDPRAFIMAIVFGASASFMTPIGYQTNLLVYGPGRYTFRDFIRVGVPLNLLFWVLATVFIPVFWPL